MASQTVRRASPLSWTFLTSLSSFSSVTGTSSFTKRTSLFYQVRVLRHTHTHFFNSFLTYLAFTLRLTLSFSAKQSVVSILQEYKAASSVVAARKVSASVVGEVVEGVADFFDDFCGKVLLYGIERPQFNDHIMQTVNKKPCEVYGSAHLLRLMVKIGALLAKFKVPAMGSDVKSVELTLTDLLAYLETHSAKLFTSKNYMETTDDYRKRTD